MEQSAKRATRFRILFWIVVALGALPSLVSGFALLGTHRVDTLCAAIHPIIGVAEFAAMVRWERVHAISRGGALVAGVLVLGYAAAWAYESGLAKGRRRLLMAVLLGVLLPSLVLALYTGRALPWQALRPAISLGDELPTILPGRSSEEAGGPAYCADHAREVNHLRIAWAAHVAAGTLAFLLTIALADLGARWRRTHRAR
jgi:hypothetical protein